MQSQLAYLEVLEPPRITGTSGDQTVREGDDVVLRCDAQGHPQPTVRWRREDKVNIRGMEGSYSASVVGQVVSLTSVSRRDSGPYLCIAANGVPPAVSRRVLLQVTCEFFLFKTRTCRRIDKVKTVIKMWWMGGGGGLQQRVLFQ